MSLDPIAYTYEADYHCPDCALARFGQGLADGTAEDDEGNEVGAVFPWSEWWDTAYDGTQVLMCSTCFAELDRIDDDQGEVA